MSLRLNFFQSDSKTTNIAPQGMAIAAIAAIPFAICAATATYVTYGLATCFGFDAAKTVESYFPCCY